MKGQWMKYSGEIIHQPIADEIRDVLKAAVEQAQELKVCIGTDSQVKGKAICFATVIVFTRKGRGGFMFIQQESIERKMTIRERMLAEVAKSIEVAFLLCTVFNRYSVSMEVHADINTNPNFKSNIALKDAMGYITGSGFVFKAKPAAFASSSCANKMVQ